MAISGFEVAAVAKSSTMELHFLVLTLMSDCYWIGAPVEEFPQEMQKLEVWLLWVVE